MEVGLATESRHKMIKTFPPAPSVGIVAVLVILDAIVVVGIPYRETGRCPVVVAAPGFSSNNNSIECFPQNCRGAFLYPIMGLVKAEGGRGARTG